MYTISTHTPQQIMRENEHSQDHKITIGFYFNSCVQFKSI